MSSRPPSQRGWTLPGAVAVALLLAGCSMTQPISEWHDDAFQGGPFETLLVLAIDDSEGERRVYEDTFVKMLGEQDIAASPSWRIMRSGEKVSKDSVLAAVAGQSFDGVIVTHLIGTEERELYHPPRTRYAPTRYSYGFYGYYSSVYDRIYEPGYYTQHRFVKLETNVYDIGTEALVWSMQSETMDPRTANELVESLAATVIGNLQRDGLL